MQGFNVLRAAVVLLLAFVMTACTGLVPGYQQPEVSVISFGLAPESSGTSPHFNIGVRVVNPNRSALPLRGMTYSVEVGGKRILSGAEPHLPTVEGYSAQEFVIQVAPDLIGSVQLLADLFTRQRTTLDYTFRGRLDVGALLPVTVEQGGEFGLPGGR